LADLRGLDKAKMPKGMQGLLGTRRCKAKCKQLADLFVQFPPLLLCGESTEHALLGPCNRRCRRSLFWSEAPFRAAKWAAWIRSHLQLLHSTHLCWTCPACLLLDRCASFVVGAHASGSELARGGVLAVLICSQPAHVCQQTHDITPS
jgi:hypothetical protein